MLLALRNVGAVGDEHGDDGDAEQERRGRLDEEDRDQEQREARVGERDDRAHEQHARDPGVLARALRERDHRGHREDADGVLGRGRQERGWPVAWTERRPVAADEGLHDADRDDRAQQKLRQVEPELRRPLPAADDQCRAGADQASRDELGGRVEEDPVDHRDLAHRERVGAATDVEVNHLCLGHVEQESQRPPRDGDRSACRRPRGELDRRDGRGERDEHDR